LESSSVGPNRIITCYKDAQKDPTHTAPYTTVEFDGPILNRPDNILVGVGYQSFYDDARYNYPWVLSAPTDRWYFDCTQFQPGDQVNNIVGEEWDAIHNNGHTPPALTSSPTAPSSTRAGFRTHKTRLSIPRRAAARSSLPAASTLPGA
jgi:hypothetical protein